MIFTGLGSNVGDRADNLLRAIAAMEAMGVTILKTSTVVEVPAMLPPGAPKEWDRPFLNQVIEVKTSESPLSLLRTLKSVEQQLGRQDRGRWGPREIDLDLLAHHDAMLATAEITVPHPGIREREFVLGPLAEIAPTWRHPVLDRSAGELLAALHQPKLVAILNLTPDSFSGDGLDNVAAVARFEALLEAGADIVDIGAESTRPGATPLSATEEWERLQPALAAIRHHPKRPWVRVSLDTRHAEVAEKALAMGIDMINDVSGLADAAMLALLKKHSCPIIVMHALTVPADLKVTIAADEDPVKVILAWKESILKLGIARERLIFDPGIGFGKTAEQSHTLIERADELVKSGDRWLFGHSRKSFMSLLSNVPAANRDPMTLAFSLKLAKAGVHYLRVHNIAMHRETLGKAA